MYVTEVASNIIISIPNVINTHPTVLELKLSEGQRDRLDQTHAFVSCASSEERRRSASLPSLR
jgi:hypothetical protein